jgi:hypothetical protein
VDQGEADAQPDDHHRDGDQRQPDVVEEEQPEAEQ